MNSASALANAAAAAVTVRLRDGSTVLLDDADYRRLHPHYRLYRAKDGNSRVMVYERGKWGRKASAKRLDRILMGTKPNEWVRHLNSDVSDCRRANMRVVRDRHESYDLMRSALAFYSAEELTAALGPGAIDPQISC